MQIVKKINIKILNEQNGTLSINLQTHMHTRTRARTHQKKRHSKYVRYPPPNQNPQPICRNSLFMDPRDSISPCPHFTSLINVINNKQRKNIKTKYGSNPVPKELPFMLNWRSPRPPLSLPTARAPLFFFLLLFRN